MSARARQSPRGHSRCSSPSCTSSATEPGRADEPQDETGIDRSRPGRHHEAFERREPHRRVDRPAAAHRAQRRARAEMTRHDLQLGDRDDPASSAARAGRVRVREAVEAEPAQRPACRATPAGSAYDAARPAGASRGTRCRSRRRAVAVGSARRAAAIAASARGWCSGASGDERRRARTPTASSITTGAAKSGPPCTTRWPTASIAPDLRRERARSTLVVAVPVRRRRAAATTVVVLVEHARASASSNPTLTTSRLTPVAPTGSRPVATSSSRTSGRSSPYSRVYSTWRVRSSTMCWRTCAARGRRARAPGRSRPSRDGSGPCRCARPCRTAS